MATYHSLIAEFFPGLIPTWKATGLKSQIIIPLQFCTNSPQSRTSLYLLSKFDDCSPPLLNIGRISQSYVTK